MYIIKFIDQKRPNEPLFETFDNKDMAARWVSLLKHNGYAVKSVTCKGGVCIKVQ
jgi:hypothetical protein